MRVPIEGEAGIGYVMRAGFDLPPLMFTSEDVEAIIVGLAMVRRTGDVGLQAASNSVSAKIAEVLPDQAERDMIDAGVYVAPRGVAETGQADLGMVRRAIREETKLRLTYADVENHRTERTIKPLAILYYVEVVLLSAWCEVRVDFRHFRVDRIVACEMTEQRFMGEGKALRTQWREQHDML